MFFANFTMTHTGEADGFPKPSDPPKVIKG